MPCLYMGYSIQKIPYDFDPPKTYEKQPPAKQFRLYGN